MNLLLKIAIVFGLFFFYSWLWVFGHVFVSIIGTIVVFYDMRFGGYYCTKPYMMLVVIMTLFAFPIGATYYTISRLSGDNSL